MSANDTQVGGSHYRTNYQHWDFMADTFGLDYFKETATKYVSRWRKKNGVEDLEKARHYLVKLKELMEEPDCAYDMTLVDQAKVKAYVEANQMEPHDAWAIRIIMTATNPSTVQIAIDYLDFIKKQDPWEIQHHPV